MLEININYPISGEVFNEICSEIWNAANIAVSNKVNTAVKNVVRNEVYNLVRNTVGNTTSAVNSVICNAVWEMHGGSIWPSHYAYYSFYRDILNIKLPEKFNISEQLALNSTFSLFYENVAYVCDRPKSIKTQTTNNRGILHNTSGPAIHWRDNFKQWYIEGVEVDEQIVMSPETQTIDQINIERNEERRRIRIERYEWVKYLEHSGAILINSRINERDNQQEQLYEHEQSNRFICVDPSTGRKYAIAVPHEITTCLEAQKYLSHGLDKFAIHRS